MGTTTGVAEEALDVHVYFVAAFAEQFKPLDLSEETTVEI
jgi:hypothetical protein